MDNQYNKTITACFTGYIVQAAVNNFTPLLFLFFQRNGRAYAGNFKAGAIYSAGDFK